ncbi:terpene synthase family protein [Streptomyces sp. NRRL B-1347]|uniref:terpene synthase family protein n=1 Tax=Streptomyces sp. NRRL B-1347 TaxID=1476877 RepID=UPI000692150D|nr:hypothetical protein [Streptomyces sp. NRRL B-1347]
MSPDLPRAASEHLAWPRRFGLLPDTAAEARHAAAHYAELAARFHPATHGADLDLGIDQMSWFFVFDDLFDRELGTTPALAKALVDLVAAALDDPWEEPRPDLPSGWAPPARAFRDLWERSRSGMSLTWRERAARHWRTYLHGYITEAHTRLRGNTPTVEEHIALRRDTIGVQPTIDLAERLGHYEVPEKVFTDQPLTEMRAIAAEVDSLHNDICSAEKERSLGDVHNIVLILSSDGTLSFDQAVCEAAEMLRRRTTRFVLLEAELPQSSAYRALSDVERTTVDRYVTDALRTVMRGDLDWAENSGRYDTPDGPTIHH